MRGKVRTPRLGTEGFHPAEITCPASSWPPAPLLSPGYPHTRFTPAPHNQLWLYRLITFPHGIPSLPDLQETTRQQEVTPTPSGSLRPGEQRQSRPSNEAPALMQE